MDQIADGGVAECRAAFVLGSLVPDPVAAGIGAAGGGAGMPEADERDHGGGHQAGDRSRTDSAAQDLAQGVRRTRRRVLVVGAGGMIGQALVRRLCDAGHDVVVGVRDVGAARQRWPQLPAVQIDYLQPDATRWQRELAGVGIVINAVGIFREHGRQTFDAIHVKGPGALFHAAAAAGVERIVQLSALGASPRAEADYLASKGRADTALAASPLASTVVRPSLVFSPAGRSTRWFTMLAALPLAPLPEGGRQQIQPIHLDDLCDAMVALVAHASPPAVVDAVGPIPLALRDYLAELRQSLGLAGRVLAVPYALAALAARLASRWRGSLVTPEALRMLRAGSCGDPSTLTALLGHPLRPPSAFVTKSQRSELRRQAQLDWLVPLLRFAMASMWIVTGIVSAFVYPVAQSLELLAAAGVRGMPALVMLYAAAALDVALGVAMLLMRRRKMLYRAQALLVAFYTAVISIRLPEYWAHPYGPVLKNIPLLVAIWLLHELDEDDGSGNR